ncbi:orotate phosphoribosyltransferase [Candidatus Micrarchaeota archaeon]|nr:orotate phosphoribosyltransferase [Candidatus Micrarchaeota archaeon]
MSGNKSESKGGIKELCIELFDIGAVKFGEFKLKSGLMSPIYIDLRLLVSYPETLRRVARELIALAKKNGLKFDRVAGIPYAALPIATAVSLESNVPMIFPRKEQKGYGTRRAIEGVFREGETVLVYDDLITTAESKFEAIEALESEGLKVKDVVVLVDREQGGEKGLAERGYRLHALIKISEMLEILRDLGKITEGQFESTLKYFREGK